MSSTAVIDLAAELVAQLTRAGLAAGATVNGTAVVVLTRGRHTVVYLPDPVFLTGYLWGGRFEHSAPADMATEHVAALVVRTQW